ncbi:TolB family protein [Paractinoplanes durhamensis]|uniref:TolB family protein n=1 Tax=Paractinoplanes durhamensis TaxID=113563 RepID=UPI003642D36D
MAYARKLADGQRCEVHTYDVATGATALVHTDETVLLEAPNWTAGGDLILNGDGLLWRLPADGSSPPERIAFDGLPELNNDHVLAPDGTTIFVSANDGHLYQAPLRGGAVRRVTADDTRMHFLHGVSPDGTTLAYVGIENQDWTSGTIRTIGTDGTHDTRLTEPGGRDDGPEYSPDGEWIHFNTESFDGHAQIARIRPDGSGCSSSPSTSGSTGSRTSPRTAGTPST